jgi:hypothetical protein
MNVWTACGRGVWFLMVIAASLGIVVPASQAQPVSPPITKDIVDAAGAKLGSITFATLTTTPGGITDFDLEGFTEAGLLDGPDWQIDPVTGEVSSLVVGFLQGDPPIVILPAIACTPPAGDDSCAGSVLLFGDLEPPGRSFQVLSYACTVAEGGQPDCESTIGPVIPITLVDPDGDGDGVPNAADNCPNDANADQADTDGDGIGDVCEPDGDEDGIADDLDNCPAVANADQIDTDGDAEGDACDANDDGDGFDDLVDNCPLVVNDDQADLDRDGEGDACDLDADGDGVVDADDRCLGTLPGEVSDAEGCAIAQLCPCDGPWRHHIAYVLCTAKAGHDFRKAGLISLRELVRIVFKAGKSQCGRK